jgi:Fe-S cluster biogenesis protein NfuA
MADEQSARVAGERVEKLLAELREGSDPRAAAVAEDLVRCLVELYGAGLARIVDLVGADAVATLAADPLVESLLLIHDLHPLDADTRIQRALDRVRPYLGSHAGGVDYLGIDDAGVVHLRLEGSCHGCPSSTVTVQLAIEAAIQEAAPETTGIDVQGVAAEPSQPPLLQIGRRPSGYTECPTGLREDRHNFPEVVASAVPGDHKFREVVPITEAP